MESTNNQSVESTTYTLTKTTLKNGKFHYVVTDNNGNIISESVSRRHYVACTISSGTFFGRLDLIGKGKHKELINDLENTLSQNDEQIKKYLSENWLIENYGSIEAYREYTKNVLIRVKTIAYLNK